MKDVTRFAAALLAVLLIAVSGPVANSSDSDPSKKTKAGTEATPTDDEQVASLEDMCAQNAGAMAKRQKEKSLYERLGGEEKIHAFTRELVRLHLQNKDVAYFFDDLDADKVARRVALFIISGTGGPAVYDGPDLTTSHAHMKLTNADFLAAGHDVVQAMKNVGYGQNEIDEMICTLVGLRGQVVLKKDDTGKVASP